MIQKHKLGTLYKMPQKTILVTGCAGFIGSNFVRTVRRRFLSVRIVGIDNFSTGRRDALDSSIAFYEGSVLDIILLDRIFKKHRPQFVFHFAAVPRVLYSVERPFETTLSNIAGTVAVLEKSRDWGVKRFIYSSSSSIYGGAKKLPTKEDANPPQPISPYGLQKYVGEPFCHIFSNLFGLDTVSLRYFNVFGPGQYGDSPYSTVVSGWLEGLYYPKKKKLFLEGDGLQSRDFCYVENVVDANIRAMQYRGRLNGEAFNIAHGERTNLKTVKRLIEKLTGRKLLLEHLPPRVGDVRHTHADISKARATLGYHPRISFEQGLKKTVDWFEERVRHTRGRP